MKRRMKKGHKGKKALIARAAQEKLDAADRARRLAAAYREGGVESAQVCADWDPIGL